MVHKLYHPFKGYDTYWLKSKFRAAAAAALMPMQSAPVIYIV